ncbi:MAG: CHAP domain-containing protein, partial [Clostridia bacterium]|nr:CHAP domain-containing protein [Clostridia bacterium]
MTISKVFTEKKPITAKTIVDKALSFIGTYDGGNNNVIFNTDYYGKEVSGSNFPWCAAFLWDIFRMCKAEKLFCDGAKTAYCPYIHSWGQKSDQLVDKTKGEYGDIVLFDWNGDGVADHVGLILSRNSNGTYETVEGNTASYNYSNGGYVLKMTRYYSSILAIIRPKYESDENGGDTVKKFIIDVSEHQGVIDWNKVKSHIDGAIIRCGYGDDITSQDDKQYVRNLSECERLKIPKGIYLYSYATTETQAKSELAHILRLIKGHTFELPIFLDCEEAGTESFAPKACKIICDGVKAAGFTPGVYSSTYWWNTYLNNITSYIRWVAHWNSVCGYTGEYLIWQYGTEYVDGINGKVDSNYYYGDFAETTATIETETTSETDTAKKDSSKLDIYYQVY